MTYVYYPSCKIKQFEPQESARMTDYLRKRFGIDPVGCCRIDHRKAIAGTTPIVLCPNCHNIISEQTDGLDILYAWELIDEDPAFPFPDYHGEKITIQDCWMTRRDTRLQDTIRSLLKKMNLTAVELADNRGASTYCGTNLVSVASNPSNLKLAPHVWGQEVPAVQTICADKAEQEAIFRQYCRQFTTEKAVTYCNSCNNGLKMGGLDSRHIIQLLFPEQ